jgi:hypothetical protein
MNIAAKTFEIGQTPTGITSAQTWINKQISTNSFSLLGTATYSDSDNRFLFVLMGSISRTVPNSGEASVVGVQADVRNGVTALLAKLAAYTTPLAAPVAPTLSTVAGGTLTSQGTLYVKTTLVTALGETVPSAEASSAVANNFELAVASPVDATGTATGWNVYIGSTSGSEKKQNSTPIALGTAYTLTTVPSTVTAVVPTANTSARQYLAALNLVERDYEKLVTVLLA